MIPEKNRISKKRRAVEREFEEDVRSPTRESRKRR